MSIYNNLQRYYREELKLDDHCARLGNLLLLEHTLQVIFMSNFSGTLFMPFVRLKQLWLREYLQNKVSKFEFLKKSVLQEANALKSEELQTYNLLDMFTSDVSFLQLVLQIVLWPLFSLILCRNCQIHWFFEIAFTMMLLILQEIDIWMHLNTVKACSSIH